MKARWDQSQRVVDLLSGRWVLKLMEALADGPLWHNELQRSVQG
jgi:DNA-binding HxlR family transcriptional regulator